MGFFRPHSTQEKYQGGILKRAAAVLMVLSLAVAVVCVAANGGSIDPLEIGEEILFESGDLTLSGSLLFPEAAGPHPAVVMLVGSGEYSYRRSWEESRFAFWKLISEAMLDRGFAVLLFDKRGINRSEGSWTKSSFEDRANDALAAVAYLQSRPEIDAAAIGLVGHSQGGWVAQLAAAWAPTDVAFLVTLAGATISVKEQILDDYESEWVCAGLSEKQIARKRGWQKFVLNIHGLVSRVIHLGYLSNIINYDPAETLRQITQPMLAIFGETDHLVYPEKNAALLEAAFAESGNPGLVIETIPGANHGFQLSGRCFEWDELEPAFASGFIEMLTHDAFYALLGL
jgi:pimeloyl-ACP methyl ester carboxylesterase